MTFVHDCIVATITHPFNLTWLLRLMVGPLVIELTRIGSLIFFCRSAMAAFSGASMSPLFHARSDETAFKSARRLNRPGRAGCEVGRHKTAPLELPPG